MHQPVHSTDTNVNAIVTLKNILYLVSPKTFVSDDALLKQLYLVTVQVTDKWTMPVKDWGSILMQLMIFFGDRVNVTL